MLLLQSVGLNAVRSVFDMLFSTKMARRWSQRRFQLFQSAQPRLRLRMQAAGVLFRLEAEATVEGFAGTF